ncbi:MAG: hypothetical protein ACRYGR_08355 [Janthinobacterium lividum]
MIKLLIAVVCVLVVGCSSAPQPPQVSLTEDVDPINFLSTAPPHANSVITSTLPSKGWRKQLVYPVDHRRPSPEFFYVIAHADQIITTIKPPSINVVFNKLQADLRKYGIATPVELLVVENSDQQPQVILDCVKFSNEENF